MTLSTKEETYNFLIEEFKKKQYFEEKFPSLRCIFCYKIGGCTRFRPFKQRINNENDMYEVCHLCHMVAFPLMEDPLSDKFKWSYENRYKIC